MYRLRRTKQDENVSKPAPKAVASEAVEADSESSSEESSADEAESSELTPQQQMLVDMGFNREAVVFALHQHNGLHHGVRTVRSFS